jgi:uncharacterized protein
MSINKKRFAILFSRSNNNVLLLSLIFLLLVSCSQEQPSTFDINSISDPKTLNESYVSNPDLLLSDETVADLNGRLASLDQSGVAHIDVVFVKSIGDQIPKDVANVLFRKWKIGDAKKNNGLLILMVKDQRRIEFETGYGLEGSLPDVLCYRIQQEHMVPYAKANNYNLAVLNGVEAIIRQLQLNKHVGSTPLVNKDSFKKAMASDSQSTNNIGGWFSLVILILYGAAVFKISGDIKSEGTIKLSIIYVWILLLVPIGSVILLDLYFPVSWIEIRQILFLYFVLSLYLQVYFMMLSVKISKALKALSHHEEYIKWYNAHTNMEWSSKAFPLLRFYWLAYNKRLRALRDTPLPCTQCKKNMVRLSEAQDDDKLSQGQRTEEQLDAIDYDVWECSECKNEVILQYRNIKSKAIKCPKCHYQTLFYQKKVIIKRANSSTQGRGYKLSICKNCDFNQKDEFSIPILTFSSSSGSSSSSSSNSSSSSSGGSSGGGGAGSSW